MKVVITGASGFLGKAIANSVYAAGHHVCACVTEIPTDSSLIATRTIAMRLPDNRLQGVMHAEQPDWVIHCAGSSGVGASFVDPAHDFRNNVLSTEAVYQAIANHAPHANVIFLSSAAVYGQPTTLPIRESTPIAPLSPYGEHKRQCELLGEAYCKQHGLKIINLRVFSAYGPGLCKQVLWDVYKKSLQAKEVVLEGTGNETRDFIHVSDIARVIHCILDEPSQFGPYLNLASGRSISIAALAKMFLSTLGHLRPVVFTGNIPRGTPQNWSVDTESLLRHEITSSVSLENGLADYVRWLNCNVGVSNANRVLAVAG